ncbi:MAG: helix-turn-helix domain-containing protein [Limisphaerales bacterium]
MRNDIATNTAIQPENGLLTKREIAAYLRVTTRTVENMTRDGRLVCIRIGRTVRFHLGDVLDHLRRQQRTS